MNNTLRIFCTLIFGLSASVVFCNAAFSQAQYPVKPITFIVAYAAGGGGDARSRQIAQKMSVLLKQPIVVENKPGAGGNIGTEFISRAAPDGYTIGMGNFAPMAVNKTLFGNLRYDPQTDLTPIMLIEKGPLVLVVNPKSSFKSVADIVKTAKAKPGELTFSSGGIGGSHQLSAELFKINAGIDMIHVPYKSGSAGLTDLMAGNVNMMFDQMYSAIPGIQSGKLRPIAITSQHRSPLLPDVPTFAQAGYPKVEVLNWQGIVGPKGMPADIIDKLNAVANEALKDPQLREIMLAQGNEIGGGSPEVFAELIETESAKWSSVIKIANIRPD